MENPIEIQEYLKGVDYPASKQDLINKAQENGAPSEVMDALNALSEDGTYDKPTEVQEAIGGGTDA